MHADDPKDDMELTFERLSTTAWSPPLVGSIFAGRGVCGLSANGGLIRFHDAATGIVGQEFVNATFATLGLPADVFAFDWRGRQFAVTVNLDEEGVITAAPQEAVVVALDPFDMTITPWVPLDLFERALGTPLAETALNPALFDDWRRATGTASLGLDDCAGASVPGFYGGPLEVGNFTKDPLATYLSFTAQLWSQAQDQAVGDPAPTLNLDV